MKLCITLVIGGLFSLLIKENKGGIGYLIGVTGMVAAGVFAISAITPIIDFSTNLNSDKSAMLTIVVKALGIAYVTEFAACVCKDIGENSLAMGVELVGKAELLTLGFPVFKELTDVCIKLLD